MPKKIKPVLIVYQKKQFLSKTGKWAAKHGLVIFICAAISAFGTIYVAYSSPGTTTIGEDISTTDLTTSGNTILGSDSSDTVTFNAKAGSDLDMNNNSIKNVLSQEDIPVVYANSFTDGSYTAGIQEAHDWAKDTMGWERFKLITPPGTYTQHQGITIDAEECHIEAYGTFLEWPVNCARYVLAANAASADTFVTLSDSTGLEAGWEMVLYDDSIITGCTCKHRIIDHIDGNDVHFTSAIGIDLQVTDNAYIAHTFKNIFDGHSGRARSGSLRGLHIDGKNGNWDGPTGETVNEHADWLSVGFGTEGDGLEGVVFEDVTMKNMPCAGLDSAHGPNMQIRNCWFENCGSSGVHSGWKSVLLEGNHFEDCWFGFHSSTELWGIRLIGNEFFGNQYGIEGISMVVEGRDPDHDQHYMITGNYFRNTLGTAIKMGYYTRDIIINGNVFHNSNTGGTASECSIVKFYKSRDIIFSDNVIVDDQAVSTTFAPGYGAVFVFEVLGPTVITNNAFINWAGDADKWTGDMGIYLTKNVAAVSAIIDGNSFQGDWGRSISVDANAIITNNSFAEMNNSSTALFLRDEALDLIVKNNYFNVTTPFYDNEFAPNRFICKDNIGGYLSSGSGTLSTGQSPALRLNIFSYADENADLIAKIQATSSPGGNHAIEHYFEWDNANSNWDLVITWKTDPGTNMSIDYYVEREK